MKNILIPILAGLITLSSCTTDSEWNRGATGAAVGSMFGSLIGDIVGGYHGSTVGALMGGAAGAAVGVASARNQERERRESYEQRYNNRHANDNYGYDSYSNDNYGYDNYNNSGNYSNNRKHRDYNFDNGIGYGNGSDYSYHAPESPADFLEIRNIVFADNNNNRMLEGGETAYITFEITNHSSRPIYNIAPVITSDNRRIAISPTATIAKIDAGRGMRYKAMVRAQSNVRSGMTTFSIGFAEKGNRLDQAKTFHINVVR